MTDSAEPICFCMGATKSVHAYCRFAIMIIAMSEATSWNQRLLMLTMQPPPPLPAHVVPGVRPGASRRRPGPCTRFRQRLVSLPRPAGYGLWVAARTRGSGLETGPGRDLIVSQPRDHRAAGATQTPGARPP